MEDSLKDVLGRVVEDFLSGKTCGLYVLVLPDDSFRTLDGSIREMLEERMLGAADHRGRVILATGERGAFARQSIGQALVNGYNVLKGGSGRLAAAINRGSDLVGGSVEDLSGLGVVGGITRLLWKRITDSPVAPLASAKSPDEATLATALEQLCSKYRVILYVRGLIEDERETRDFLFHQCGRKLHMLLGDRKQNMFVLFPCRQSDFRGEEGAAMREWAEESEFINLVDVGEHVDQDELSERLARILMDADEQVLDVAVHFSEYLQATDGAPVPSHVLREACRMTSDKPLGWLRDQNIVEVAVEEAGQVLWALKAPYGPHDLEEAIYSVAAEREDEFLDEADEDDEAEPQTVFTTERAARHLFDALRATEGQSCDVLTLVRLADRAELAVPAVHLAAQMIHHLARAGAISDLRAVAPSLERMVDHLWGLDLDDDAGDINGELADTLALLTEALESVPRERWEPHHGILGRMIRVVLGRWREGWPVEVVERAVRLARQNLAYAQFLTDEGRVKLVAVSPEGIRTTGRNKSTADCLQNPSEEGSVQELLTGCLADHAWLFFTGGRILRLPLDAFDARYDEQTDAISMRVRLQLSHLVEAASPILHAACLTEPAIAGAAVLLVTPRGRACVLPLTHLPLQAGQMGGCVPEILDQDDPARWAIVIRPGEAVFVAGTDNRILRLSADDLLASEGTILPPIKALDEDEQIAAVVAGSTHERSDLALLVATERGYGGILQASDFDLGRPGQKGVVAQKPGKRSGNISSIEEVYAGGQVILSTRLGHVVRLSVSDIPRRARNRVGVKLMPIQDDDALACGCGL